MKNYILTIALGVVALSAVSCGDFLDVQTEGNPTTNESFANDQQVIDAIDALYYRITDEACLGRELYWEQGGANEYVWGRTRGYPTLATLEYTGDESPLRDVFGTVYYWMGQCNWMVKSLLDKKAKGALTPVETRGLGEAYFMRAFYHYLIAHRYGTNEQGVPFVAWEDVPGGYNYEIPTQQATVMDDYAYIISDLKKSEELLPKFEEYDEYNRGRTHKAAVVALMVKTYAYWATWDKSQWDNVIACVNDLETKYGRGLADNFKQLFSPDFNDFFTREYCFGIVSEGGTPGGGIEFGGLCLENKGWGKCNGWGQFKPSLDIYEEMLKDGEGNERLKNSILEYGDEFQFFGETMRFYSASDVESGFQINKYMQAFAPTDPFSGYFNTNGDWPTTRINFPVIRFADCLLLRAEAYLVKGDVAKATADINRIRTRSHLQPIATADWTALYHERLCELAFEPAVDHLHDLKRWVVSGDPVIAKIALNELTSHPRARHYADRMDPDSEFTVGPYDDYQSPAKVWDAHKMVFPYPSETIRKSGNALKQNPGY